MHWASSLQVEYFDSEARTMQVGTTRKAKMERILVSMCSLLYTICHVAHHPPIIGGVPIAWAVRYNINHRDNAKKGCRASYESKDSGSEWNAECGKLEKMEA